MGYARGTTVSQEKTRIDLERLLGQHGAQSVAFMTSATRAAIEWHTLTRRIRFKLNLPDAGDIPERDGRGSRRTPAKLRELAEQEAKRRWRVLLLTIKAKLEAVEVGVETEDEAFLAHVVMPDGRTIGDHVVPRIEEAYSTGQVQPLLPAGDP